MGRVRQRGPVTVASRLLRRAQSNGRVSCHMKEEEMSEGLSEFV